jgi:hypothetical protein
MRRAVLMVGLAALAAVVLPLPAHAGSSGTAPEPRPQVSGPAPATGVPFTLGEVPCSLLPVPAATAPVGTGTCPRVRPGGRVVSKVGLCTLNFLFRAPDGTRYIGTAGHCIGTGPVSPQEKVWPRGSGPVAQDADGKRIGEFAYAVLQDPKDFALIQLDPGVDASPEMCSFGAPRGVYTTDTAAPVVLQYYGNGDAIGSVLPARSAVALGTPNPDHVYAAGLALPGDGGTGVMTADGLAIGVLVSNGPHGFGGFEPGPFDLPVPDLPHANEKGGDFGTMGITRLGPQVARASEKLGVPLELVTAG